ncbi:hypothetical protein [Streptomyces sp. NBC_00878]|uniref:hypothetical protein n=1 Tax=Streptomyces sp. NBC_00878 TaxID=2975854 RepID=UPI0022565E11|nr:hypothetical protein [Streptomyces sp. NBC_00878]MCX4906831.1 hypothetical protein [Streptomyces sp. NBC_00878]
MSDKPHRPPHLSEELRRFHNGDTLDDIPVVRPAGPVALAGPAGPVAAAVVRGRVRPRLPLLALVIPVAGVIGGLAGVGAFVLADHGPESAAQPTSPAARAAAATPEPPAMRKAPASSAPPTPSPSPPHVAEAPVPAESVWQEPRPVLEQVRVIQTPQTGGDPGASYCLVYTGGYSGPEREAILLMNAAGYQCQDMLPVDPTGQQPPFSTEAPTCEVPARAALLTFAEVGGWEDELLYTCLYQHRGA